MVGFNNPFNIRSYKHNKWKGQIGVKKGFCCFVSMDYGIRAAAFLLMRSYRQQGIITLSGIIDRFAPRSENDTYKYLSFVHNHSHCDLPSTLIDYCLILQAMSIMEGNPVPFDQILICCRKFKIEPYELCSL